MENRQKYAKSLNLMLLSFDLVFAFKFITYPSECNDIVPVWTKIISQIFYVSVYCSVIAKEIKAPDIGKKFFSGQSNILVLYQIEQKIIFLQSKWLLKKSLFRQSEIPRRKPWYLFF